MAAADDKTEKPTAKRKADARKKGQVAKSADLSGAGVLIAGLIALMTMGPAIVSRAGGVMVQLFGQAAHPRQVVSGAGLGGLFHTALMTVATSVGPIAAITVAAAILVNVAQIGLRPNLTALKPDFKRINPASGAKNLFGPKVAFEAGKALAKVGVVGAIVAIALIPDLTHLGASVGTSPYALGHLMSASALGIAERAAIGYLLIGLVDYIVQRRRHNKELKMTKQEVKEEHKSHQLPPEVRSALRRRQMQQARARMMAAVPQADVVVTNPTHFSVALSYDGEHPAPVVVAKGQDHVALQIRKLAEEHGVPIVPDPPLARELHRAVEIGQMIPADLYAAVAQVLAFVYRLAARKKVAV
jgi:flagellar biosynthetic protein FlhB